MLKHTDQVYTSNNEPEVVGAHDLTFNLMISGKKVQERIRALSVELVNDFKDKNPLFIGILNGAFIFTADLTRSCDMECEIAFMKLSSYKDMESTGDVATILGLDRPIKNRNVIIVEDIIDTGITLHNLIPDLEAMEPESITICALLVKPDAIQKPLKIDYTGFEIENKFVIGYGLDYNEHGRSLTGIYQLASQE